MFRKQTVSVAILFVLTSWISTPAHASIVYNVNRTIEAGTVVGTVTTDGTIGPLLLGDISAWAFTITAPNLVGSPSVAISSATGGKLTYPLGLAATPTELIFNFDALGAGVLFANDTETVYWCLTGANACNGEHRAELIGETVTGATAQIVSHTGEVSVATAVSPVPIPAMFPIFAAVLGLLGFFSWRKHHRLAISA
jgi:hypothetical protein